MEVHNVLGPGYLEPIYEEALIRELSEHGIEHTAQVELSIDYKGSPLNKKYRADLIVEENVLLELKAVKKLSDIDKAQILHYLKTTGMKLGLLINFGQKSLTWKRFVF